MRPIRLPRRGVVAILTLTLGASAAIAPAIAAAATVQGGPAADNIRGTHARDTLNGGGGNDTLSAFRGNDYLNGQDGRDTYFAGPGNDVIYAQDGVAESVVCGPGRDSVTADAADSTFGCEAVARAQTPSPPTAATAPLAPPAAPAPVAAASSPPALAIVTDGSPTYTSFCFKHSNGNPYTYDTYAVMWNGAEWVRIGSAAGTVNGCNAYYMPANRYVYVEAFYRLPNSVFAGATVVGVTPANGGGLHLDLGTASVNP